MAEALEKQRTNVTLNARTLQRAREMKLNISAISDAALKRAVAEAEAKAWAEENADAIEERTKWIEENGMPLADVAIFKVD